MKDLILAIDQGTSSTRAILFDKAAQIVSISQKETTTSYPAEGFVEQDPSEIWSSVLSVMSEVISYHNIDPTRVIGMGITNQRETTILWNKNTGVAVHPAIVWQSRQTQSIVNQWKRDGLEELVKEKTGLVLNPYFSASKIRYILDQDESFQRQAEAGELLFGTIETFLLWKFTRGKAHKTDVTNASRTMLMNLETGEWDETLLEIFNIPKAMLPTIIGNDEVAGEADPIYFFNHALPIASLIGDQQAALFGQACFKKGMAKNTYGTGCFALMQTGSEIVRSQKGLLSTVAWKRKGILHYALEGSVFIAGSAVQWLRDGMKLIRASEETEALAQRVDSTEGLILVPAFVGLGAPYWDDDARGAVFGITRATKKEHLVRATLEAICYETEDILEIMREESGLDLSLLKVDGGAVKNNFLMQFQSDISQTTLERQQMQESTAVGTAFLAGLTLGFWKDQSELTNLLVIEQRFNPTMDSTDADKLYRRWKRAVHATMSFKEE